MNYYMTQRDNLSAYAGGVRAGPISTISAAGGFKRQPVNGPIDNKKHQGPSGEVNSVVNGFEGRGSGLKYDQNTVFADQR